MGNSKPKSDVSHCKKKIFKKKIIATSLGSKKGRRKGGYSVNAAAELHLTDSLRFWFFDWA